MKIKFEKYADGLVPAIVQDADSGVVLMLGFMNADSLAATEASGKVTFYSRSRSSLWTKGETSDNFLSVVSMAADCDSDTLLIKARPSGPVCHTGSDTCFGEVNAANKLNQILELERTISDRRQDPKEGSYVSSLFAKGINKIAQKVGEEAVELVIEAKDDNIGNFKSEAADLLFHYLVLLNAKGVSFDEVLDVLADRRR